MELFLEIVNKHGLPIAIVTILGAAFLLVSRTMFYTMVHRLEAQDKAREEREQRIDEERRAMTQQVIDLTTSATRAIESSTRELIEFRRDTSHGLRDVEVALTEHAKLVTQFADESRVRHERLSIDNERIRSEIKQIQANLAQT